MSLIYAHKIKGKVRILSDTKIYVDPNYRQQLEHELTKEEAENIVNYGMIKTIIYRENITISSAGHIDVFNELHDSSNTKFEINSIPNKLHSKDKIWGNKMLIIIKKAEVSQRSEYFNNNLFLLIVCSIKIINKNKTSNKNILKLIGNLFSLPI